MKRTFDQVLAQSSRSCSNSPLKELAKNAELGKSSGVFSKMPFPEPQPQASPSEAAVNTSSWSKTFNVIGNTLFFGTLATGGYFGYYTYAYDQNEVKEIIEEQKKSNFPGMSTWCSLMEFYLEKRTYFEGEIDSFSKPRQDTLLPDQYHPHKKTLVLDLDDLLVHSDWTRERGWKVLKRPGLEAFLREILPYFEVVVYSDQLFTYVDPIMDQMDPNRMMFRLHRADTLYVDGKHVRDLSRLGREMDKVLMVSAKPDAWAKHPENTLKLSPWKGDAGDTMLLDLIPFLKFAAQRIGLDMRQLVEVYDGKDIPATFRARMQELGAQQQKSQSSRSVFGSYLHR